MMQQLKIQVKLGDDAGKSSQLGYRIFPSA
jgi:hypothetical protein